MNTIIPSSSSLPLSLQSHSKKRRLHAGFTLVELLVVIMIIAVLAGLGFSGMNQARKKAKRAVAKKVCVDLVHAVELFHNDYGTLPEVPSATINGAGSVGDDTLAITGTELMKILLAKEGDEDSVQNQKQRRYVSLKEASTQNVNTAIDGLVETATDAYLFDPWKKSSRGYYVVVLDSDYNDEIQNPCETGKTIYGQRVLVFSSGADGLINSSGMRSGTNLDNVYSWSK